MVGVLGSATLKAALAGWLLLTNLSLGLYHRHESTVDAHRAEPTGWHYHVLLLGVELDFLSVNSETCPFRTPEPAEGEAHLLLGNLIAPANDHDAVPSIALLLAAMPPGPVPAGHLAELLAPAALPRTHDVSGLPPPASALAARSGVQQV